MNRGLIWMLVFMLLTATKAVYLGHLLQGVNPVLLLLGCFGLATTLFVGVQVVMDRSFTRWLMRGRTVWPDLVWLNLTTAVAWFGYYFALWFGLEPAVYGSIANAGQPIATIMVLSFIACDTRVSRYDVLTALGVFAGVGWLVYGSWAGMSAVGELPATALVTGVGLSLLSALAMAGNTIFVTRLHRAGLNTMEAMAMRFFALLVMAWVMLPGNAWSASPPGIIGQVAVVALLGVALPLFCFQRGVEQLRDPQLVAMVLGTMPVLQLLVQLFDPRLSVSACSWVGVGVTVAFSLAGIVLRTYSARLVRPLPQPPIALEKARPAVIYVRS